MFGTIKGAGKIYQQTVIDTYSGVAAAKLYTDKTPISSADILNDRVILFFAKYDLDILRILADRGLSIVAVWSIMHFSCI